jgi:VWFA-related protein
MQNASGIRRSFWSIALSVSLLCGEVLAAQQPGSDQGVIRVTTRLVQINMVVHDKKGEPVGDLTQDDIELFDKGQQQKILFFSKESSESLPKDLPPLAPGVVSNRFVNSTSGGQVHLAPLPTSLTVVLLDGLNTASTDQHYAKDALIRFLNQLQPSDRVAIYS